MNALLPSLTLAQRDIIRFFRQRGRVIGALATPIMFWILLGLGVGNSFEGFPTGQRMSYLEYFAPGIMLMIILFSSIFAMISIIEDRQTGFLQGVLVSPVRAWEIVSGKTLGAVGIALAQVVLFTLVVPIAGISLDVVQIVLVIGVQAIIAATLALVAFCFAWRSDSIQGFHAVMNTLLFPMWLLSGALFPATSPPLWLRSIMYANPLTYGNFLLRYVLYFRNSTARSEILHPGLSLLILFAFLVFFAYLASILVKRRVRL